MRSFRTCILLLCFLGMVLLIRAQTGSLTVERQGDHLRVAALQFHFLEGKPLEQLHNGASVTYALAITISAGGTASPHRQEKFILSYDLWEEKFSVVQVGPLGKSASHLSAAAAEAWCLDNIPLPMPALSGEKMFLVKLECAVLDNESSEGGPGLTLATLIDVFSRKKPGVPLRWEANSGPLRMQDVKEKIQKGAKDAGRDERE